MIALLTTIHILTAVVLVLAVLLQSSKGSDVAGAFGGMGSQAAFGPRGTATFLSKATMVLAAVFVVTSISLVRLGNDQVGGGDSVLSDEPVAEAPATPAAPAAPASAPNAPISGTATTTTVPGAAPAAAPAPAEQPTPQVKAVTPNPVVPTGIKITNPAPAPAAAPVAAPAKQ
jgi:preprotein translocase subunit SecG